VKFLHRQRGKAAIEAIGLIPRFRGTLVHDCWAAYLSYEQCTHQLCGSYVAYREMLRTMRKYIPCNWMTAYCVT
ncbi:MAG: transposase, partial [Bryobacterales bacterium]|nr:transposase [Bryobacterales bacterium]